jgi:hypothetical protein
MADMIIVSGLPRSGTSMLMRVLEAGGVTLLTDSIRKADLDNPNGYFELEQVKHLPTDTSWLVEASGKALKIISTLLYHLPERYEYKILFMERNLDEVIASQNKMLERLNQSAQAISDDTLKYIYEKHVIEIKDWLGRTGFNTLFLNYNVMIKDTASSAQAIQEFLQRPLHIQRMMAAIDASLYRQRRITTQEPQLCR